MDKIIIRDLLVHAIIGVEPWERETPQDILVNIEISADLHLAGDTDQLGNSINYAKIAGQILEHCQQAKRFTVEALAEDIAQICLLEPIAQFVVVRVEKPDAIQYTGRVGVELIRSKR